MKSSDGIHDFRLFCGFTEMTVAALSRPQRLLRRVRKFTNCLHDNDRADTNPNEEFDSKHDVVCRAKLLEQCNGVVRYAIQCHVQRLREKTRRKPDDDCVPENSTQIPIILSCKELLHGCISSFFLLSTLYSCIINCSFLLEKLRKRKKTSTFRLIPVPYAP